MVLFGLDALVASSVIDEVILVVPRSLVADARALVQDSGRSSIVPHVVEGGRSRSESVRQGLAVVSPGTEVVVCHDAARPFASPDLFRRALDALHGADAVVPVIRSPDTVKRLNGGRIVETIPRNTVGLAQTPQVFRAERLRSAHEAAQRDPTMDVTDDAMLLESAGFRVAAVDGESDNFKITTAEDLRRAESLLGSGSVHWLRLTADPRRTVGRSP
jgi:2-C-methyl-D-erythritol 4-phosphate cytidylyltransferase